ncbi:hypothetical protein [Tenacibaculum discolor]|uniref:hypothetical protein n=1 Tax=Tenacibaculum discolor TaxID=361581 RepID=UPI003F7ACC17
MERLLLCLATDKKPKSNKQIKETATHAGLGNSILQNISTYLKKAKGYIISTPDGWELTDKGWQKVDELAGISKTIRQVSADFDSQLSKITNSDTKEFIKEAIACYEHKLLRSSVVLSWVGAISLLQDYVLIHRLTDFNIEALRRDSKWKTAKIKDDLSRMKEYDFLQILVSLSIIGKNVKDELETCLKLRNGCGHPNSLKIGELRVSAHLETLILNVYSKF